MPASSPRRERPRWEWPRSIAGRWARRPIASRASSFATPAPKGTRSWTAGSTCPSAGLNPTTRSAASAAAFPRTRPSKPSRNSRWSCSNRYWPPNSLAVAGSPVIVPLAITSRSWNNCPKTSTTWRRSPAPAKSGPKRARPSRSWKQEGCTVEQLLTVKSLWNWQTHKIAEGEKGPMVAAFARVRVYLSAERTPESERWLLLRNDANGQIKYALSNAPQQTSMRELVRVSGARWPIERCFQENKSELGLDHYEHRSWTAWHRHMRLVFLAQLFLLRLQIKFKKNSRVDLAASPPAH